MILLDLLSTILHRYTLYENLNINSQFRYISVTWGSVLNIVWLQQCNHKINPFHY